MRHGISVSHIAASDFGASDIAASDMGTPPNTLHDNVRVVVVGLSGFTPAECIKYGHSVAASTGKHKSGRAAC
jgi:hypothetical protein